MSLELVADRKRAGFSSWYSSDGSACFSLLTSKLEPVTEIPGHARVADFRIARGALNGIVRKNPGASLIDLGQGIACLELHSPKSAIGGDVVSLVSSALNPGSEAVRDFSAFVLTSDAENFSVGANLMQLLLAMQEGDWDEVNLAIRGFQQMTAAIKFCPRPVVVEKEINNTPVRIVRNSDSLEAPGEFERGKTHDTIDMDKLQTTDSNQKSAADPVSAAPLPPVTPSPAARVEDPPALSSEIAAADVKEPEPAHQCVSTIGGQCTEPATRLWLGSWVCEGHYYEAGPLQPHVREWRSGRLVDLCDSLGCTEESAYHVPGEPEPAGITYLCEKHYRPRLLARETPAS